MQRLIKNKISNAVELIYHSQFLWWNIIWIDVCVTRLKMNVFINKLNKRTSVKNILQVNIFMKINFSVWIISIYYFYAKRMNLKIDWIHVYKIKFTNEKKMQNFEQKIIKIYFDCVIINEIHMIRTSNNNF